MYKLNTTRRRAAASVVALSTIPVMLMVTSPGSATGTTSESSTLTFRMRTGSFRFIDMPPKAATADAPPSPGDYLVLTNRIFKAGDRVGTLHATCVVTRRAANPDRTPLLCTGAYRLPGGTLTGTTVLTTSATTHIAITGGTGRFAGASGTSTEHDNQDGTTHVTIRLR
jgi:hypothetical protein